MTDLTNLDAKAQSEGLASGAFSAAELMRATLDKIHTVNGPLNAIVSLKNTDTLMAEAIEADSTSRKGWLHGIPIAIKDLANAAGLPNTMGSPLFEDTVSPKDDITVARLKAAGAIVIGKTNVPEFGLGSHTFNPVFGATKNPYNTALTCGGSSGGAAVALAARMTPIADGSDMMGSLRNPAGWNNVYGMRPTWGNVPSEPVGDTFGQQLSTLGPMARTPRDLAALLATLSGPDPRQPHTRSPVGDFNDITPPSPLRLGWLEDWGASWQYEPGIVELCESALAQMQDLGHRVTTMAPPFSAAAVWSSWMTLRNWALVGSLSALYDNPDTRPRLKESAQWEVSEGHKLSALDVHKASVTRSQFFAAIASAFDDVDVLCLPCAQVWPFDVDQVHPTEINGIQMDTYHRWMEVMIPASLIGLPAISVPVGFGGPNDMPMGLQLIGRQGSDHLLLRLAHHWHLATSWPEQRRPAL